MTDVPDAKSLTHFGKLGMRWGIRRKDRNSRIGLREGSRSADHDRASAIKRKKNQRNV